jgi:hypothetical protein
VTKRRKEEIKKGKEKGIRKGKIKVENEREKVECREVGEKMGKRGGTEVDRIDRFAQYIYIYIHYFHYFHLLIVI